MKTRQGVRLVYQPWTGPCTSKHMDLFNYLYIKLHIQIVDDEWIAQHGVLNSFLQRKPLGVKGNKTITHRPFFHWFLKHNARQVRKEVWKVHVFQFNINQIIIYFITFSPSRLKLNPLFLIKKIHQILIPNYDPTGFDIIKCT